MRKYTYSRTLVTPEGIETFTADKFDSFDEGQVIVDKGIADRKLQILTLYPGYDFELGYNNEDARKAQATDNVQDPSIGA